VARRTRWGIALLAVVQNRDAARLMGIPIRRVVAAALRCRRCSPAWRAC
jgi:branched-chain amino acid transport system permease protein